MRGNNHKNEIFSKDIERTISQEVKFLIATGPRRSKERSTLVCSSKQQHTRKLEFKATCEARQTSRYDTQGLSLRSELCTAHEVSPEEVIK